MLVKGPSGRRFCISYHLSILKLNMLLKFYLKEERTCMLMTWWAGNQGISMHAFARLMIFNILYPSWGRLAYCYWCQTMTRYNSDIMIKFWRYKDESESEKFLLWLWKILFSCSTWVNFFWCWEALSSIVVQLGAHEQWSFSDFDMKNFFK